MNLPHHDTHPEPAKASLDEALRDIEQSLNSQLGQDFPGAKLRHAEPAPATAGIRPPASSAGRGGAEKWGPNPPRMGPVVRLEAVVGLARSVQLEVEGLMKALTGEEARPVIRRAMGPVPAFVRIEHLASEIEGVLNEVGRLVEHMRLQL